MPGQRWGTWVFLLPSQAHPLSPCPWHYDDCQIGGALPSHHLFFLTLLFGVGMEREGRTCNCAVTTAQILASAFAGIEGLCDHFPASLPMPQSCPWCHPLLKALPTFTALPPPAKSAGQFPAARS